MTEVPDIIQHSVTRDERAAGSVSNGMPLFFMVPSAPVPSLLPADPPPYWSPARDDTLSMTIQAEDMWASAIAKAITKMTAMGWNVDDTVDSKLRTRRAQELLLGADAGQGWVSFLSKHLAAFLCTDNGAFVEIVRATRAPGSKILGLMHLDSHRCQRTGDPEIPVLYRDRQGRQHELRAHQVLCFADMPDPRETWNGVGHCAASRAYRTIRKLSVLERYVDEKLSGDRVLAIHIVNGVNTQQLTDALRVADVQQQQQGYMVYKGAAIMGMLDPTVQPEVATIPLAELPDGFDAKQERDNAYVKYANAIGIAVQDIQPLSGQGLGTGTQTVILDEAAEGQGLAAWRKQFEHLMNEWVLPATTTFSMVNENDLRDQKARAEVQKARADARKVRIDSGEITAEEARQLASEDGDLPPEWLTEDLTPGGTLSDDEKPVEETALAPLPPEEPEPLLEPEMIAVKAASDAGELVEREIPAAVRVYQSVMED